MVYCSGEVFELLSALVPGWCFRFLLSIVASVSLIIYMSVVEVSSVVVCMVSDV